MTEPSSVLSETDLEALEGQWAGDSRQLQDAAGIENLRRTWLGKDGIIKSQFQRLRDVPADAKPKIAGRLNALKATVEKAIEDRTEALKSGALQTKLQTEFVDLSLPGLNSGVGQLHPLTRVERQIFDILEPFGFEIVHGPEVETEYYCFDALNIPKHHPARDMQDTFFLKNGHVLRTHTTSVQARALQNGKLPVKVVSLGRVYRNETEDASHQSMFHQFELVWVEEGLTLSNLLALITHILKEIYGRRRKVRFVPKFYPYTEPSIGPQLDCSLCKGKGCPACGHAGWVTVGGAGMVHRKVLEEFKLDPAKVSGFAFGLGSSRMAGQFFDFNNLRSIYENDLRVLRSLVP
jgi:phenylalanyl-tRNA synthetase alpha chain